MDICSPYALMPQSTASLSTSRLELHEWAKAKEFLAEPKSTAPTIGYDLINADCFKPLVWGLLAMQQKLNDIDGVLFFFSLSLSLICIELILVKNQRAIEVIWKSSKVFTCLQEFLQDWTSLIIFLSNITLKTLKKKIAISFEKKNVFQLIKTGQCIGLKKLLSTLRAEGLGRIIRVKNQ